MEILVLIVSMGVGLALFFWHQALRKNLYKPFWDKAEFWFPATPKPIVMEKPGGAPSLSLPLEINGEVVNETLPNEYWKNREVYSEKSDGIIGYLITVPIKCCVVGKNIVGIQYSNQPPVTPENDLELKSELTPANEELDKKIKNTSILLYLSIIALIPAAYVFLNMLVSWFK